ncbi:class I SAM-dependent methyltransferase [Candidatus Microgenomates bacterium]|jgi:ubiquinone/menaquinone biosynthesis C-methylase UbiE|nr:MAG: class I SAM-dependent methyltransferase [Candidatus Microgenomates bacterium]
MNAPYDSYDYLSYWQKRNFEDCCEREALKYFFSKVEPKGSIVDIGGGFGRLADFYSGFFKECLVVDPSKKLLEIGEERCQKIKNVSFKEGTLPKLPVKDGSFDVAIMIRVSHHLEDPFSSFKEIQRVLKKDGYFIVEIANKIHFLARLKACLKGDFSYCQNLSSVEKRSWDNIKSGSIPFLNHHPLKIIDDLKKAGFLVEETLSVSNLRHSFLKLILPGAFLINIEKKLQKLLAPYFFGPSFFILARKRINTI